MVLSTWLGLLLTCLLYLVIPVMVLLLVKNKKVIFILSTILIVMFVVVLYFLTLGNVSIDSNVVFMGLDFSGEWCSKTIHLSLLYGDFGDVVINVAMLIPIGAYIVIIDNVFDKKHTLIKALVVGFIIGLSVETLQFILPVYRSVQLRDVLLNSLSTLLGAVIYKCVFYFRKKLQKIN